MSTYLYLPFVQRNVRLNEMFAVRFNMAPYIYIKEIDKVKFSHAQDDVLMSMFCTSYLLK